MILVSSLLRCPHLLHIQLRYKSRVVQRRLILFFLEKWMKEKPLCTHVVFCTVCFCLSGFHPSILVLRWWAASSRDVTSCLLRSFSCVFRELRLKKNSDSDNLFSQILSDTFVIIMCRTRTHPGRRVLLSEHFTGHGTSSWATSSFRSVIFTFLEVQLFLVCKQQMDYSVLALMAVVMVCNRNIACSSRDTCGSTCGL